MDLNDFEWVAEHLRSSSLCCYYCDAYIAWKGHSSMKIDDIYYIDMLYVSNVEPSPMHDGLNCRCGATVGTFIKEAVRLSRVVERNNGLERDSDLFGLNVQVVTVFDSGIYGCLTCNRPICFPSPYVISAGNALYAPKFWVGNVVYDRNRREDGEQDGKIVCACGEPMGLSFNGLHVLLNNVILMLPMRIRADKLLDIGHARVEIEDDRSTESAPSDWEGSDLDFDSDSGMESDSRMEE